MPQDGDVEQTFKTRCSGVPDHCLSLSHLHHVPIDSAYLEKIILAGLLDCLQSLLRGGKDWGPRLSTQDSIVRVVCNAAITAQG